MSNVVEIVPRSLHNIIIDPVKKVDCIISYVVAENVPTQSKAISITSNGQYKVMPDDGYKLDYVDAIVNVSPVTYTEFLSYSSNGSFVVYFSGTSYVSQLNLNINVSTLSPTYTSLSYSSNGYYHVSAPYGQGITSVSVYVNVSSLSPTYTSLSYSSNGYYYVSLPYGQCVTQIPITVNVPTPTAISVLKFGHSNISQLPNINTYGFLYENADKSMLFEDCRLSNVTIDNYNASISNFYKTWGITNNLERCFENNTGLNGFSIFGTLTAVTKMDYMLHNCYTLTHAYINPDRFDNNPLRNVKSVEGMFMNCYKLGAVVIPQLNNCTNFKNMFQACTNLTYLNFQNLTAFNSSITELDMGLSTCTSLSKSSLSHIINLLPTTSVTKYCYLGTTNINKLTSEISVATSKGWQLV